MHHQVIFKEKYGQYGREFTYIKPPDQKTIVRIGSNDSFRRTFLDVILNFLRQIFLPHSYPHSVSEDYYNYQKWDTIQAFCSTITGILTTRAILTGVGVGDETATPLAATVTMILKDGTGMVGKILFTWWKSPSFDSNCKQWRLFADIINDAALFLELGVPFISTHVTEILCISTTFKALVGVAGGATRAAITQHQAVKDNVADVSAKDGSQETIVNLIASFSGIYILSYLQTAA
ncbi:hypothetical protein J437_LFUL005485 [Ladona fulva]|uniref:Protein root UVB sensitive/RUS domain-containing protein n=1 Tax=Ladona fulva TaxID=123851 RepID=A0A8K0NW49_LADFU|nr:hypothetical protein J437_LFUL005485 [Ladona fulva]